MYMCIDMRVYIPCKWFPCAYCMYETSNCLTCTLAQCLVVPPFLLPKRRSLYVDGHTCMHMYIYI